VVDVQPQQSPDTRRGPSSRLVLAAIGFALMCGWFGYMFWQLNAGPS
jgi:hypothetical protein